MIFALPFTGCSYIPDKAELDFEAEKLQLERQVEILSLKKRKALLEKQLDALHNSELEFAPAKKD